MHILDPPNYDAFVSQIIKQHFSTIKKGLLYKHSISKGFSIFSNDLRDFLTNFDCSIPATNHCLGNVALLFVARYCLFQRFDLLCIVLKGFLVLRFKMSFYA